MSNDGWQHHFEKSGDTYVYSISLLSYVADVAINCKTIKKKCGDVYIMRSCLYNIIYSSQVKQRQQT